MYRNKVYPLETILALGRTDEGKSLASNACQQGPNSTIFNLYPPDMTLLKTVHRLPYKTLLAYT